MSTDMINPGLDLAPLNSVGGFDTDLNPTPRGFMITEDKSISVITGNGNTRTYPVGTFTTKIVYPLIWQRVRSSGTEIGEQAIFLVFDKTP
jgi:hypothetical protein